MTKERTPSSKPASTPSELDELRTQIDLLDTTLLKLLANRASLVKQVGVYKRCHQLQPLDKSRWQKVLQKSLDEASALGLSPEFVESVYTLIHNYSLQLEQQNESLTDHETAND